MSEMVKKWKIAPFINKGTALSPEWVRIKKSTAFDLTLNGETSQYDYISDESPTTELLRYAPSLSQALTMYKGEEDYNLVFDLFYELKTGSEAHKEILIAFFMESEEGSDDKTYYKAWKSDAVLVVSDLNSVDSTISFDINFGGTISRGYVTLDSSNKPTFVTSVPASE